MNKRGIESEVFRWILISIAGVVILSFFIGFASREISISDTLSSREFAFSLENQLQAMSINENSNKIIEMPIETSFGFSCGRIVNEGFEMRTDKIIFAPAFLDGKNLKFWIKEWRFPYKIGSFYYGNNEKTGIVLVYDAASFNKVNSLDFPSSFKIQKVMKNLFNEQQIQNSYSQRDTLNIILFTNYNIDEIFNKIKIQNLNVVSVNVQQNTANVHTRTGSTETFYLGDDMLAGLIIGVDNYLCMQERALEKLDVVSDVYYEKARLMSSKEKDAFCKNIYFEMQSTILMFKESRIKDELYDYEKRLEEQNRELLKNGCGLLF
jgi:hypothetical protein